MKLLTLIRHAKSSWDEPDQPDQARDLNERGRNDTRRLLPHLRGIAADCGRVFLSSAQRTRSTAELLSEGGLWASEHQVVDETLYTFDGDDLLRWLRARDDHDAALTIVGHNPALFELVNALYAPGIPRMPTLTVIGLSLHCQHWSEVDDGIADLRFFYFPKLFRSS